MAEEKRPERPVLGSYEGKFTFEDLKFRKLRNGHRLRVVVECEFDEGAMGELAMLLEKHVKITFKEFLPPKEKAEADQEKIDFDGKGAGKN